MLKSCDSEESSVKDVTAGVILISTNSKLNQIFPFGNWFHKIKTIIDFLDLTIFSAINILSWFDFKYLCHLQFAVLFTVITVLNILYVQYIYKYMYETMICSFCT